MSNITIVYDSIRTTMDAIFTAGNAKTKIPNAYIIEENPRGLLKNGWGLTTGASDKGEFDFKSILQVGAFDIVLTRELLRLDSNTIITEDVEKLLLEDCKLIQNRFEQQDQLGLESNIEQISAGPRSSIDVFPKENETFLTTTQTIIFQWSELL